MAQPTQTVSVKAFRPTKQIGIGGLELGPRERHYLQQVIDSNRLSYGPFTKRFEELFASVHGCRVGIFCSSGTAALQLAIAALKEQRGWHDGDEVIVPAVTFVATANTVLHNNLKPVLVDVDPHTYNLNPGLIESRLTMRTRAIVPVHLLGLPADMNPICDLATAHQLTIVEDACETMFATYCGKPVGSFGAVSCFSTYMAHFLAAGIGGFATTNDAELALVMRSLLNHGRDHSYLSIDDDQGISPERLFDIVARRFSFVRIGYNFRVTEFEAAIGLAQLENRAWIIRKRKENAEFFISQLRDLEDWVQLPSVPPDREHLFMLFPLVLRHHPNRELINFLEANLIETRDVFPLVTQPVYQQRLNIDAQDYPVAAWLATHGFLIGCHQYLTDDERQYIVDKLHEFFHTHHPTSKSSP